MSARWGGGGRRASRHGTGSVLNGGAPGHWRCHGGLPNWQRAAKHWQWQAGHSPRPKVCTTTTSFGRIPNLHFLQAAPPPGPQPFMTGSVQPERRLAAIPAPGYFGLHHLLLFVFDASRLPPVRRHSIIMSAPSSFKDNLPGSKKVTLQPACAPPTVEAHRPPQKARSPSRPPSICRVGTTSRRDTLAVSTRPWDGMDAKGDGKSGEIGGGLIGSAAAQRRGRRCGCVEPAHKANSTPV